MPAIEVEISNNPYEGLKLVVGLGLAACRWLVEISNNPYEGLKLTDKQSKLSFCLAGVEISNNPYEGLKQFSLEWQSLYL